MAAKLFGNLSEENPGNPEAADHKLRMAAAQTSRANLLMNRGSYEEARTLLEDSIETYRPLADNLSSDPELKRTVAEAYQRDGAALRQLGLLDEGLSQQARVIELLDPIAANPNASPKDALLLSRAYFERGRARDG